MKPIFFTAPSKLRVWFEANHEAEKEVLIGFYKRATGKPSVTWPESVDEALCFGWIDGIRRSLGEEAYTIRFTPRRTTSIWSAINVARVAELTKLGKMKPAGLRAFAARTPGRTGVYSFERKEAAQLSPAQLKQLRANKSARAFFERQAPWYQRTAIHWVISAKREETRERRLHQLIEDSAAGRTIPPLTSPGKKKQAGAKKAGPKTASGSTRSRSARA